MINFKSNEAFPDYSALLKDRVAVESQIEDELPRAKKTRKTYHVSNFAKKSNVKKVMWSKVVNVRFYCSEPTKIYIKYDYEEEFMITDFCTTSDLSRIGKKVKQLYEKPLGISAKKKADLIKLCDKD